LTDKVDYLRSEKVNIRGSGYKANEKVLIDLTLGNVSISGFPRPVNANAEGIVTDSWTIPSNASLKVYTVSLFNATTTVKPIPEIQPFWVGANCEVQTKNLANQPVANVTVEIYNATTSSLFDYQETNKTGWTRFILTSGNYTFKAFWRNVEVGVINQTVTENILLSITISLSNIGVTVVDETGAPLPFIDLVLKYNYTNRYSSIFSQTQQLTTNVKGYVQVLNVFTNRDYVIEARRDGILFNTTLIRNLSGSWNNITIIASTYNVFVTVLDSKNAAAKGLTVKAYDWSSGIGGGPLQIAQTNSDGNVTFSFTVGKYRLRLYYGTTFLNEVTVNLKNQTSLTILCNIYNVDLNVLVVDLLGQPIPNVSVDLQRKNDSVYKATYTNPTRSNGVASFNSIIGGDSRINVSLAGRTSKTQYLYLVGPTKDVVFKFDGYVTVAGYALETSQFVTIVILLIIAVALIAASTYRKLPSLLRRRKK
jgi:5-hydroxyisourate hydrolase-like protein (transthyretin family)